MELKTKYQYTYFIYPYAIKEEKYEKYVLNLIKDKKYKIRFFDSFRDVDLYKYFVPTVKEKMFQDFSFDNDKLNKFYKMSLGQKKKLLNKQNCLIFEYVLENQMHGKIDEKDGIFFDISKIELVCFNTGICFLAIKTHLEETEKFSDLLNFNYKFENINFENKNIKKLNNIKIQTNAFDNMNVISEIINNITGQKIESGRLDIDENLFLIYTYACLDSSCWNNEKSFENIENEFVKLVGVRTSNTNINVDYDKLSILANSSFMKMRMNNKCMACICSTADTQNYTSFPEIYERQYFYTYIIALHQKYYLKKLNKEFEKKPYATIKKFINFTKSIWISEITPDSFGQKIYKRCKEKMNIEEVFNGVKNKYDVIYKKLNIEKSKKMNIVLIALTIICILVGIVNVKGLIF